MVARRECAVLEALRVDAGIDPYSVGADSISARIFSAAAHDRGRTMFAPTITIIVAYLQSKSKTAKRSDPAVTR